MLGPMDPELSREMCFRSLDPDSHGEAWNLLHRVRVLELDCGLWEHKAAIRK